MPAAAVIPAPLAYIKVVAVKKLVVEFLAGSIGVQPTRLYGYVLYVPSTGCHLPILTRCFVTYSSAKRAGTRVYHLRISLYQQVYLEKIRVLTAGSWGVKAPLCLNNVAWNNRIRPRFYSVGLIEQQISWLERSKVHFKCGSCELLTTNASCQSCCLGP